MSRFYCSRIPKTYLREERLAGMVDLWMAEAGELALLAFLVRMVTPPSAPGWTPMAYSHVRIGVSIIVAFAEDYSVVYTLSATSPSYCIVLAICHYFFECM